MTKDEFKAIVVLSVPVMVGYIPIGIVYGFFCMQAGLSWQWSISSSLFILAGASQFAIVPMFVAGVSLPVITFAVFIINFRHVFYGIPMLNRVPVSGWKRWYSIYAITDETFSLVMSIPKDKVTGDQVLAISAINHFWWVLGTALGAFLGAKIQINLAGLDFILCCLFATLALEQWRIGKKSFPLWCGIAAYLVARYLSLQNALALASAAVVFVGYFWAQHAVRGEKK